MQQRAKWWLTLALVCLAFGWLTTGVQAQTPTGTWKWTVTFNDQTREQTLKLKLDGNKLTGSQLGRDNQEYPIQDATFKDGEIAFQVIREFGGQKVTTKYKGKLLGDTIKGTTESNFGGENRTREWEAKRSKDA
jgi:hypothetical protein